MSYRSGETPAWILSALKESGLRLTHGDHPGKTEGGRFPLEAPSGKFPWRVLYGVASLKPDKRW
jgi:hypothetical protein